MVMMNMKPIVSDWNVKKCDITIFCGLRDPSVVVVVVVWRQMSVVTPGIKTILNVNV